MNAKANKTQIPQGFLVEITGEPVLNDKLVANITAFIKHYKHLDGFRRVAIEGDRAVIYVSTSVSGRLFDAYWALAKFFDRTSALTDKRILDFQSRYGCAPRVLVLYDIPNPTGKQSTTANDDATVIMLDRTSLSA